MIAESAENFTSVEPALTLLDALHRQFSAFAEFRPLKVGIHNDILEALPEIDHAVLKAALSRHCRHPGYLRNLAKGGDRYGLDGQPAGEITEEHRTKIRDGRKVKPKKPKPEAPPAPPAPTLDATPPAPAVPAAPSGRPILKLKPKTGPVIAVSIARKPGGAELVTVTSGVEVRS